MGWHLAIALLFLQGYQTKGFSLQTGRERLHPPAIFA
jgi:hypothetical protein